MNKCLINPICNFNQIPINLLSKQNTSAHRAGDFLLESWINDYLWNHCFWHRDYILVSTTPGISHYSYYDFDYGWWLCLTLRQSTWKQRNFTMPSLSLMECLETKTISINRRLFILFFLRYRILLLDVLVRHVFVFILMPWFKLL